LGANSISVNYLDTYLETKKLMRYTSSSSVRVTILLCLNDGLTTMSELKKETGISSSTLSHNLSELEKRKITTKEEEKYGLTSLGNIITTTLIENIKTNAAISKFQKLWMKHDISGIPIELIKSIGDLHNSVLVEAESGEIFKPHETYQKIIFGSEYIKGISPIFRFDYIDLYKKLVIDHDVDVELILTQDIVNQTMEGIDGQNLECLQDFMSQDKVKFWVIEDVKIAFTVTNKYLSLGLFHENGDYDNTKDLISDDHGAIAWGNQLFEYYRDQAQKLKL
jgi:predicted transcriptional regulator